MLTPFKQTNGDEVWVNPIHVRYVCPDRGLFGTPGSGTLVCFGPKSTGLHTVCVAHSPRHVAEALNKAMPPIIGIQDGTLDDQHFENDDASHLPSSD